MKALSKYQLTRLREAIRLGYGKVAVEPNGASAIERGKEYAISLGYDREKLEKYASSSVEAFMGVGVPLSIRPLEVGQTVVDIGSGAGTDSILAASEVGSVGFVFGIEMTPEMIQLAREQAFKSRMKNLAFTNAFAERLPIPAESVDVVISNGVINLCPDKNLVFDEIYRILKPGGRIQIADIVVLNEPAERLEHGEVPDTVDPEHLLELHVRGALTVAAYSDLLKGKGFVDIWIGDFRDVFHGHVKATAFKDHGVVGAHIYAEKPIPGTQ